MSKKIVNQAIFWDYNIDNADFNDPQIKIWYLNRKLQFGDLYGINKKELKTFLPKLTIDPSLKDLLANFLTKYA